MSFKACSSCGNVIIDPSQPCSSCGAITAPEPSNAAPPPEVSRNYDYDVFISFKNRDKDGGLTEDSGIATQLYEYLQAKGLRVFFSARELESLGKSQFTDVIDNALETSRVLIAVGSSSENLESKWVQYEWSSFLKDMRSGLKPNNDVYVLYRGMRIVDLPRSLRLQQAFNADESDAFDRLCSFVQNALTRERNAQLPPGAKGALLPQEEPSKQEQELKALELGLELEQWRSHIAHSSASGEERSAGVTKMLVVISSIAVLIFAFWGIRLDVNPRDGVRNVSPTPPVQTQPKPTEQEIKSNAVMVINDLKSMKTAAIRYEREGGSMLTSVMFLLPFLDSKFDNSAVYRTHIDLDGSDGAVWWVGFDVEAVDADRMNASVKAGVKKELSSQSHSEKLYSEPSSINPAPYTDQYNTVWVPALTKRWE